MVGGNETESIKDNQLKPKTQNIREYFNDLITVAILYGMTSDEFWYESPALMWSYRIAYIKKQKLQNYRDNQMAWLSGLYNYNALSVIMANAFSKGSNQKYIEKPIDLTLDEKESKKLDIRAEEEKIKARALEVQKIIEKNKKGVKRNGI